MRAKILLSALLLLFVAKLSLAADYYVDITNNTGYTIYFIYVSPSKTDSWEEDVLGDGVLLNSDSIRINLNGYSSPIFDIRLVDEDGDSYTFYKINVSKEDLEVTLDDLD